MAGRAKTAMITGASSVIGLELTRRLLAERWEVAALNRSQFPEDDEAAGRALREGRLRQYRADLTDYRQLKRALDDIRAQETALDLLFNNAGGSLPEIRYSPQGREWHYELQTVVPYIILMEMRALLAEGEHRTVVNTSTSAFNMLKTFDPDALARPVSFKKLFGPYAASKLALSLWTREAAPQLAEEGIILRSADPGGNNTMRKGKPSGLPFYLKPIMKLLFAPPSKGAGLLYDAALGSHAETSGVFLSKGSPAELKFTAHAASVLANVDAIYRREYKLLE